MALPADFNKIYGSTATGGLTPISDVNYAKGWDFVGSNPPTKNDFSYLQNLSDLKSQWLYSNKLQRANPFGDIKSDGTVKTALENLGLSDSAGFVGRLIGPPKIFTSSGTYTPTAGTTSVIVEAQGAGGGGGYARATSTEYMSAGAGGGAGGYGKSLLTSGFSGVAITIGSGGSQGVRGGDTSFGSLIVAAGGGGGSNGTDQYASGSVTQYVGASGGSCTGGNIINSRGGNGGNTITTTAGNLIGGVGGTSHFTAAAITAFGANGAGVNGLLGCGGGGAISSSSPSSSFSGGNGGNGLVIIWEYA